MAALNGQAMDTAPLEAMPELATPDVYARLASSPQGLSQADAAWRYEQYGANAIQEIRGKPLYLEFLSNFTHLMAMLLWAGGAIAFITQTPELGIAIWLVNLINGSFSFWQEYRAEKAVEALRQMMPMYARVVRAEEEQRILADQLVPGDVVLLSEGDRISADARVVRAAGLRIDQATLTGESRPVFKTDQPIHNPHLAPTEIPNIVYAGTAVLSGNGQAVVFATGMQSEFGRIAHLTQGVGKETTPLQIQLGKLTKRLTAVSVGIGFAFFWLAHYLLHMNWSQSFMLALGMVIGFVPEGLLPTVTLSLAMGVQRMARRHALIKRLSSVEALGRTSVICTDKTGTLTKNEMTVTDLWLPDGAFQVTGAGYAPDGQVQADRQHAGGVADLRQLLIAAGLCNNARLVPPHTESPHWTVQGDPTEAALLVAARKAGVDLDRESRKAPRVHEIPFDSHRRRMTTIHRIGGITIACLKGSPKEVLALCTTYRSENAETPINETVQASVQAAMDGYARKGLRVLAVATRMLPDHEMEYTPQTVECELTFLGLVALSDPPRPDVREAVARCHRAGVRIVMMTGDYSLTAEGVAREIGIIRGTAPKTLTSVDLKGMDDTALREALKGEVIFSRISPEHKLRVVKVLRQMGHIVAVTGDGVNDAPALKEADIGIAMGVTGTDVAKEAADMVLTDDHFASIVNAIEEGRAVYDNIRKFTTYVFGSNMAEGMPFIITLFAGGRVPLPITVMQTLAVDLGTDMVPAIGLGADPPEKDAMERPPLPPQEHLLSVRVIVLGLLWYGLIDTAAALSSYFFVNWEHGWPGQPLAAAGTHVYQMATTMTFAGIVFAQAGAVFACRSERTSIFKVGVLTNRLVVSGVLTEILLLLALMYVPLLREIFGAVPISIKDWAFAFAWAPALLLLDEIRKVCAHER